MVDVAFGELDGPEQFAAGIVMGCLGALQDLPADALNELRLKMVLYKVRLEITRPDHAVQVGPSIDYAIRVIDAFRNLQLALAAAYIDSGGGAL